MSESAGMPLIAALAALRDVRTDQAVIASMAAAREWPRMSDHPLDLVYVPSAMGGAAALGLGLALAQPAREIVVLIGDGSLLMNLGSLITITSAGVPNLSVVLMDNGVYEVTGGQPTPAADREIDFCTLARASGFASVARFDELADWKAGAADALATQGPRFLQLCIQPVREDYHLVSPGPMVPRLARFRDAISTET